MEIRSFGSEFDNLISPGTSIELLGDTFKFTEGPVWNSRDNTLLFSDIPEDKIYSWSQIDGFGVYRKKSRFSNGLTYDSDGNLIACEHESRSVSRETGGKVKNIVDRFQGKKLNSPNDIVCAKDGSIIFSDPIYGLRTGMGGPAEQELPFSERSRIRRTLRWPGCFCAAQRTILSCTRLTGLTG